MILKSKKLQKLSGCWPRSQKWSRSNSLENTYRSSLLILVNDVLGPHIKQDKWRSLKENYMTTVSWWKLKNGSNNKEVIKSVNRLTYSTDLVHSLLWMKLKASSWDDALLDDGEMWVFKSNLKTWLDIQHQMVVCTPMDSSVVNV